VPGKSLEPHHHMRISVATVVIVVIAVVGWTIALVSWGKDLENKDSSLATKVTTIESTLKEQADALANRERASDYVSGKNVLDHFDGAIAVVYGDDESLCILDAGGFQQLGARRIAVVTLDAEGP